MKFILFFVVDLSVYSIFLFFTNATFLETWPLIPLLYLLILAAYFRGINWEKRVNEIGSYFKKRSKRK